MLKLHIQPHILHTSVRGPIATLFNIIRLPDIYSFFKDLSYLKALERPEGPIPQEVNYLNMHKKHDSDCILATKIVLETLLALFLGILGACLNTPAFKEITWSSEMRKQYVVPNFSFTII